MLLLEEPKTTGSNSAAPATGLGQSGKRSGGQRSLRREYICVGKVAS